MAEMKALLRGVARLGDEISFEGVNLRIVNGAGATASRNGLGNLIIGYNEPPPGTADRSGSHNLVVGPEHSYASYGGALGGRRNSASGPYASALGGRYNIATGECSSVTAGEFNLASGAQRPSAVGATELPLATPRQLAVGQITKPPGNMPRCLVDASIELLGTLPAW
jgi:hypothetical protein